jgi:hypothetical protein
MLARKIGAYKIEAPFRSFKGRLPALPTNNRLGWKSL